MKILSENMKNGILPLTKQTLYQLQLKHPKEKETPQETLLPNKPEPNHTINFEGIDVEKIQKAATKMQGGSGPSGVDADGWNRILTSKQFGKSSIDLKSSKRFIGSKTNLHSWKIFSFVDNFQSTKILDFDLYHISSNKRRASNKRHSLISAALLGIHIEISASL